MVKFNQTIWLENCKNLQHSVKQSQRTKLIYQIFQLRLKIDLSFKLKHQSQKTLILI